MLEKLIIEHPFIKPRVEGEAQPPLSTAPSLMSTVTTYRSRTGTIHREDGPAMIWENGDEIWYLNGLEHRTDGPSRTMINSLKIWKQFGNLHRTDGPAVEWLDGTGETWYLYDKCHRTNGPASIFRGEKKWIQNDKVWLHGELICNVIEIVIAILPLKLPAYVVLWILEWVYPSIPQLNQVKLINMIQGLRSSYERPLRFPSNPSLLK